MSGEEQLTDFLLGQVVEAVRPHRFDGHGASWRLLSVHHDQIEEWLDSGLTAVIVVMEGQPGRIAAEVTIDLARPRTRGNPTFNATREAVLAALGDARQAGARRSSEVATTRL